MKRGNFKNTKANLCSGLDNNYLSANIFNNRKPKRSQITIFIIIAILIVAGITAYFILKDIYVEEIPQDMRPVYDYYLSCLKENARQGISLLGEQGGYIEIPEFVPGSQYRPFSSQLDFFGQAVPYWMYISGNNLLREQIPTKNFMENELEDYLEERLDYCDFSDFEKKGYDVFIEKGDINVNIYDNRIDIKSNNPIYIYSENDSVIAYKHEISVNTKFGRFYELALKTYEFEKQNMFLEQYALDVLRLYAPVTGVELSCSPKIFIEENIRRELVEGLSANMGMLKLKGDYYDLAKKENQYFVTDLGQDVDEYVNFIYSPKFPTRIDIYGDKVVEPVGLQQGLGILGFCYVPYHLVYDIDFPVLIQFYDSEEIFQFPVAVMIDKNQARNALPSEAGESIESELCRYKNQQVQVYTYDLDLVPVESRIRFKCLNDMCEIGNTELGAGNAVLEAYFPQCVNGFIIASADGFAETKYQISTNEESIANIIMNRLYNISIELNPKSIESKQALVSFVSEDYSATILYPEFKNIELIEGYYNISVVVYDNSSLKLPETSTRQCVNVPKSGIGGVFGLEEERCFDITIPKQDVDFAVIGGGKTRDYFTENQLKDSGLMRINVELFEKPSNLDEFQDNYIRIEDSIIDISLE